MSKGIQNFIQNYIENVLHSNSPCFGKKQRHSIYSELRKVFNDLYCDQIVARMSELEIFSIIFDQGELDSFPEDEFVLGLEVLDKLFGSQIFEHLKCNDLEKMTNSKSNRNLFAFYCSSNSIRYQDLPKLVRNPKTMQYLKQIYFFSPPDLGDRSVYKNINFARESLSYYPMLIPFLVEFVQKLDEEASNDPESLKQCDYPESSDALDDLMEYFYHCTKSNGSYISKRVYDSVDTLQHRNNFFAQCIKLAVNRQLDEDE